MHSTGFNLNLKRKSIIKQSLNRKALKNLKAEDNLAYKRKATYICIISLVCVFKKPIEILSNGLIPSQTILEIVFTK